MIPRFRPLALLGAALALIGPCPALAIPPVLDRVPVDAHAVVALTNLQTLDANTAQLLAAAEFNAVSTVSQALGAMGLRDGLNMRGSAAGVLFPPDADDDDDEPPLLLIVPVSDYTTLINNLNARADDGVDRFEYAGRAYFSRRIDGGYALAGADRARVAAFKAEPGNTALHLEAMGPRGRDIASGSDVVVLADVKQFRSLLAGALGPLTQGAPAMGLPLNQIGGDPRAGLVSALLRGVEEDAGRGVIGMTAGPLGLRLDMATSFAPGSAMALACAGAPREADAFSALPRADYLFLGSMNLTHPGLRSTLDRTLHAPDADAPEGAEELSRGVLRAVRSVDTASIAVYAPPSLFIGALSRTIISWTAPDPSEAAAAFRSWLTALAQRPIAGGRFEPQFTPDALSIESTSVSTWALGAPPGALGPAAMLLYGPAQGPKGHIATLGNHGYLTWSPDPSLMTLALKAGRSAPAITSDVMLEQVRALLPGPRAVEWYINARPVLAQLSTLGGGRPADLPELLPPIGTGVVMTDGSLHATMFIPAPLIKSSFAIIDRVGAGGAGGGGPR